MIAAASLTGCGSGIRNTGPIPYPTTIIATSVSSGPAPAVTHSVTATVTATLVLD